MMLLVRSLGLWCALMCEWLMPERREETAKETGDQVAVGVDHPVPGPASKLAELVVGER